MWSPKDGVWMVWWMKYQIFTPVLLLQFLNLFWYILILRILYRSVSMSTFLSLSASKTHCLCSAVTDFKADDVRSDDEDDDDEPEDDKKND